MIVVNLFGAPGAGKSTGAAYIYAMLKMAGVNAELVTEFAKDKVYEETKEVWNNQQYIFGKQSFRIGRLRGKVDVVVTDSPLLLSAMYNTDDLLGEPFNGVVNEVFSSYDNINFFVQRDKPYNPSGRMQTAEESDELAKVFFDRLTNEFGLQLATIKGTRPYYDKAVNIIINKLNE